jgi:Skp family chaperone for outer membrane proteins
MKKFYFLSIFFILIIYNNVIAEQKIVFVDMDKVVTISKAGTSVLKQLNTVSDKNLLLLNKKEKNFKEREVKLISQKNIISESEFQSKVQDLKKEINEYSKIRNKLISDFSKLKADNTNKLLKLINPILIKYSTDNNISLILQKKDLIIGKTELDKTDEVIKIINNEITEFKIK